MTAPEYDMDALQAEAIHMRERERAGQHAPEDCQGCGAPINGGGGGLCHECRANDDASDETRREIAEGRGDR